MLGTLRLSLALLVVISHAGVRWYQLNPGVVAVVGFYAISGYVMAGLMRRHYAQPGRILRFYADRAIRLLPAYYAVALVTLVWMLWQGPVPPFLVRRPDAIDLLNNLLIVPLDFFMWNGANEFTLVPPAWSLGCEIQFYLLCPLLMIPVWRNLFLGASLAVFAAAFGGLISTEWFGYRLLPGVLFVFLLGACLHDCHLRGGAGQRAARWLVALTVLAVLMFAWVGRSWGVLPVPYNPETLIGVAGAVVLLHLLAPLSRHAWDERAGDLSYGVFLVHFLVFWVWPGAETGSTALLLRTIVCLALAALLHQFIEKPALAWRRGFRV